jgi:flagellar hook assembly protein FlgD
LAVFDLRGRRLCTLVRGEVSQGRHSVIWDGCDDEGRRLPAGVYVARLTARDSVAFGRLTVWK